MSFSSFFGVTHVLNLLRVRFGTGHKRGNDAYDSDAHKEKNMAGLWVLSGMRAGGQHVVDARNSVIDTKSKRNHRNNNCAKEKSRVFHDVNFLLSTIIISGQYTPLLD